MTPIENLREQFNALVYCIDEAIDGGMPSQEELEGILIHVDEVDNALIALERDSHGSP